MKIDHIAIAVDDLKEAVKTYSDLLQVYNIEYERVESEGVSIAMLHLENGRIELMEPMGDSSPIKKFLEKKGPGLHHIALETKDIDSQVSRIKSSGIKFLGDVRSGSAESRVAFMHPKSLHGVLTEICSHSE